MNAFALFPGFGSSSISLLVTVPLDPSRVGCSEITSNFPPEFVVSREKDVECCLYFQGAMSENPGGVWNNLFLRCSLSSLIRLLIDSLPKPYKTRQS